MPMLFDLPVELLARIILFTMPNDFESAMMACKHMYAAGDIYRQKHNRLARRFRHFEFDEDVHGPWKLLAAIATEPSIAHYIKTTGWSMKAGALFPNSSSPNFRGPDWDQSERRAIQDLLTRSEYLRAANADPTNWLGRMADFSQEGKPRQLSISLLYSDVFLLTLLPHVTHLALPFSLENLVTDPDLTDSLESLEVSTDLSMSEVTSLQDVLYHTVRFANAGSVSQAALSKLTHICPPDDDTDYRTLHAIAPFLALPALKTLSAHSVRGCESGDGPPPFSWPLPGLKSPVETIELYCSVMDGRVSEYREHILESTPHLRTFRLAICESEAFNWRVGAYCLDALIRHAASSLTDLSFTIAEDRDWYGSVLSFEGLPQLERLEIDVRVFGILGDTRGHSHMADYLGTWYAEPREVPFTHGLADMLPPSIKTVRILAGYYWQETEILNSLLTGLREAATTRLPNLQSVAVIRGTEMVGIADINYDEPPEDARPWEQVEQLLQEQSYEYHEVPKARAEWLTDFFRRFPYAPAEPRP